MVKVDIYRNGQGQITSYKVSGHARYVEDGEDIYCSAVSAVTQAPILGLERHLKLNPSYRYEREEGILEVALNSAPNDLTEAILETMYYGIRSIAAGHGSKYVHIVEHRR